MDMPFGKHKGQPVAAVPTSYLAWCLEEGVSRQQRLEDAIKAELGRRLRVTASSSVEAACLRKLCDGLRRDLDAGREESLRLTRRAAVAERRLAEALAALTSWYRDAARRFHPDRGGSHDAMTAVNDINARLREALLSP